MQEKLQECLAIVDGGVLSKAEQRRVRLLLRDVLAEMAACQPKPIDPPDDPDDYCWLGTKPGDKEPGK